MENKEITTEIFSTSETHHIIVRIYGDGEVSITTVPITKGKKTVISTTYEPKGHSRFILLDKSKINF